MTDDELKAIQARADAATPEFWINLTESIGHVVAVTERCEYEIKDRV